MSTPGATYPPPPGTGRWGRAARDAWSVQVRCQAVVGALGLVAALAVAVLTDLDSAGLIGFVWLVHAVVTLAVGYPVGVVVGRLLPDDPTAAAAGWWFALAGAVAALVLMLAFGPGGVLLYVPLGATVAGGARAWAHGVIARRHAGLLPVG